MLCFVVLLGLVVLAGWWWVWRTRQRYRAPIERGWALLAQDRVDEALESFSLALSSRPQDPAALRGIASCYLAKGQLATAASFAEQAIAGDTSPDSRVLAAEIALAAAGPWRREADNAGQLGDTERFYLDKAIEHAEVALTLSADSAAAHRVMGVALARRGERGEKALAHIARAVELAPEDRAVRIAAGDVLLAAGKRHEALAHYRYVAEQLDPLGELAPDQRADLLRCLSAAAKVCQDLRLPDQAIAFWHRFLAAGGDKAKGHVGLLIAHYLKGDFAQAIEEGSRAARYTSPVNPSWDLHYYRGLAFLKLKRLDRAAQELNIAISIRDDAGAQHILGTILLEEKDRLGARHAFARALTLDPRHAAARAELVKLLEAEGEVARALDELRRGVSHSPQEREPLQALAAFCRRHGFDAEAEEALRALYQLSPPSARAAADLAVFYLERQSAERALPLAYEAARREPGSAEFACLAGRAEAAAGDITRALGHFQRALGLDPNYIPAYLDMADALQAAGLGADAEEVYAQARKAIPNSTAVRWAYARFCLASGRPEQGVRELMRLLERDRRDLTSRAILVEHLLSQGSKDAALTQAREAAGASRDSLEALGLLARVYRARGEWEKLLVVLGQMSRLPNGEAVLPQQLAALMHEGLYEAAIRLAEGSGDQARRRVARYDLLLGVIHFLGERQAKAMEIVGAVVSVNPRDLAAGFIHPLMQLGMGQTTLSVPPCRECSLPETALSAWADLVRRRDQKPEKVREIVRLLLQAYVYEEVGWTDTAAEHVEKILDIEPDCLMACYLAPVLWQRAGNLGRAIAVCERALARAKGFAHGRVLLGDLHLLNGHPELARAAYAAAHESEGPPFEAGTKLALLAMAGGDRTRAVQLWRTILTKQARHMPASNNLAWLLAGQGDSDLPEAAEAAQQALDAAPDDPAVLDTVGWVWHLFGEGQRGISYLENAVRAAPYRAIAHLHLGLAYAGKNRSADALRALGKAVELAPGGLVAEMARQALQALRVADGDSREGGQ